MTRVAIAGAWHRASACELLGLLAETPRDLKMKPFRTHPQDFADPDLNKSVLEYDLWRHRGLGIPGFLLLPFREDSSDKTNQSLPKREKLVALNL